MDGFQLDVDDLENSKEKFVLRSKLSRTPSLSTISEEMSRTPSSGGSRISSEGSEPTHLTPKSKKIRTVRRLFSMENSDMDLIIQSSDSSDDTPFSKRRTMMYDAPCKKSASQRKGNSSRTECKPKTPLKLKNKYHQSYEEPQETKETEISGDELPKVEIDNEFDKLFVCGIFNTAKPIEPSAKELETLYINNSSEDDAPPSPKKRRKMSVLPTKLAFKRIKRGINRFSDSEDDSDF